MRPLSPLIHIVGFQPIHQTIINLTLEGPNGTGTKDLKSQIFRAYNIQSYDFYDSGTP